MSGLRLRSGRRTRLVLAGLAILAASLLPAPPARASDTVYYYSSDSLHSEVVITDQNRNVVERTHYAPYGQVLDRSLRDGPGYTGHSEDPGTGLVYMQQRYYDPVAGRFLSADPVQADPRSGANFNRYWYANDNPYRYTDPDGRMVWSDWNRRQQGGLSCQQNRLACENALATGTKPSAKQSSSSSRPAGQCDETCDEFRQQRYSIIHEQGETLKKAGLFGLKVYALNFLGDGIGRMLGKARWLGRVLHFSHEQVSFGRNANQISHAFRHIKAAGMDRGLVEQAVRNDLRTSGPRIPTGRTVYRTITVDGQEVTYGAHRLEDGSINVGRITTD